MLCSANFVLLLFFLSDLSVPLAASSLPLCIEEVLSVETPLDRLSLSSRSKRGSGRGGGVDSLLHDFPQVLQQKMHHDASIVPRFPPVFPSCTSPPPFMPFPMVPSRSPPFSLLLRFSSFSCWGAESLWCKSRRRS